MRARALSGAIWVAAATWTARLLSAVTFVFVGRHLTPAAFGLVALASAFVSLLGILTDSGFATYLIKSPTISRRLFSTGFWTSAVVGLALAGSMFGFAPLLADVFREPGLRDVMRALAAVVVVNGLVSAPAALMRRDFQFQQLALRTVVASLVASAVAIVMAAAGAGVWALVAQALASAIVSAALIWTWSPWRPSFAYSGTEMRRILGFGGQLLLTDLLLQARDRGEEFTLGLIGSASLLGQWSVASRLVKLVQDSGTQVVNQVSTPSLARLQDDAARLHRGYAASMAAAGALLFPVMGFLALMSRDLIPLVMGAQWASIAPIASIVAITACFAVFTYFDRPMFAIANALKIEILLVVIIVGAHLIATIVFAPLGLTALALALLGRTALTLPLRQWALHRWVGVPYTALLGALSTAAAAAVAVAAAGGAVQLLDRVVDTDAWLRLTAAAVVLGVVYLLTLRLWAKEAYGTLATVLGGLRRRLAAGRGRGRARSGGRGRVGR
jgi:O-antigen/teichoic acid export membrane protein